MTFTSIPGDDTDLQRVREAIGDTDSSVRPGLRLEDEVIEAHLLAGGGVNVVALDCLRLLLARFAREADIGTRSAGLDATRRYERLKDLETALLRQLGLSAGAEAPGLSRAYRDELAADEDLVQQPIKSGVMDADS